MRRMDVRGRLRETWWFIFLPFAVLTGRLTVERVCGNPYDLLPAMTSHPAIAWPLACAYVSAHLWIGAVYLVTTESSHALVPDRAVWRAVWGEHLTRIALMAVVLAVEYAPVSLLRRIGSHLAC